MVAGPDLRSELLKDAEAAGVAGRLPGWVAAKRAKALLKSHFGEKVGNMMKMMRSHINTHTYIYMFKIISGRS